MNYIEQLKLKLGNLYFISIDCNQEDTKEIHIVRQKDILNIFFYRGSVSNRKKKDYLLKLFFEIKESSSLIFNYDKSSSEIKTEVDIINVIDEISTNIVLLNVRGKFLGTGSLINTQLEKRISIKM